MAVSAVHFVHPTEAGILAITDWSRLHLVLPLDRIKRSVAIDIETAHVEPLVRDGGMHRLAAIVTER
jgi:hypothetical protein